MKKSLILVLFLTIYGCDKDSAKPVPYDDIQQLMNQAITGINDNVQYIVTGDSTRDNHYNEMIAYYIEQLSKANISVYNNSASRQSGQDWKNNADQTTLGQAVAATFGDGSNTILEFSLGINDYSNGATKEDIKRWLKEGLESYLRSKPEAKVLLVTPIKTGYKKRNRVLKEIYNELSFELYIPLVDGLVPTKTVYKNSDYYHDSTHPNKFGSIRIVNYILSEIGDSLFHDTVTLVERSANSIPPNKIEMLGAVEIGYWDITTGEARHNTEWRKLSSITIEPNFILKIQHQGNRFDVIFMDENFDFISSEKSFTWLTEAYRRITIPENVWYANINISSDGYLYDKTNDIPSVKYFIETSKVLKIDEINDGLDIKLRIE